MRDKKIIGDLGEQFAIGYLYSKGYQIVETNFRCRVGEIDIIATRADEIIFIEVKTRQSVEFGRPCEAVTPLKQNKIRKCADYYIVTKKPPQTNISFHVIEILVNQIENAF